MNAPYENPQVFVLNAGNADPLSSSAGFDVDGGSED